MFLLFGSSYKQSIINVVAFVCGVCGVHATQNVIRSANRFTFFFIPLFSFSTRYVNVCTNCGAETPLTAAQARNSLEWSQSHLPRG